MSSFSECCYQAHEAYYILIAKAHISDHQVSNILYQNLYHLTNASRLITMFVIIKLPSQAFEIFPLTQQAALEEAEDTIIQSCCRNKIDTDSCIIEVLDTEARTLAQINQEENEKKLRELPSPP
jgi:hypothetical protein